VVNNCFCLFYVNVLHFNACKMVRSRTDTCFLAVFSARGRGTGRGLFFNFGHFKLNNESRVLCIVDVL
jgi:hypothetical protein